MEDQLTQTRDKILEALLPDVPFDGWAWVAVLAAAGRAGCGRACLQRAFPGGVADVVAHFSDWADRKMLAALADTDPETLRVRDRIRAAVLARLEALQPHKEAARRAMTYWAMPLRAGRAAKTVWRTADRIWNWAGDTATDYNRYTKRTLLAAVLSSTTLAWLDGEGTGTESCQEFLDRRIENVMQLGRVIGKIKKAA